MQRYELFLRKIELRGDCWFWIGATTGKSNYGIFWDGKRRRLSHRWVWEYCVGEIPADREIDHLCRNRLCVRPSHLELVTHRENVLRADSPNARNAKKTHCIRGHALTPDNLYANSDSRQ